MSSKDKTNGPDNYWYSARDMLGWDKSANDNAYAYSYRDMLNENGKGREGFFSRDTVGSMRKPIPVSLEDSIKDYVDIVLLKEIMNSAGLEFPKYVIIKKLGIIPRIAGASGWTPPYSIHTIYLDEAIVRERKELLTVETIVHETWHLKKQPLIVRRFASKYEAEADSAGRRAKDEYQRSVMRKRACDIMRKKLYY